MATFRCPRFLFLFFSSQLTITCSKLTIETLSSVSSVNFKQVYAGWVNLNELRIVIIRCIQQIFIFVNVFDETLATS